MSNSRARGGKAVVVSAEAGQARLAGAEAGQARLAGAEAGQAVVEYILLISVIVTFFVMLNVGLAKIGFMNLMMSPLKKDFANVYQYGHPKGVEYKPRGGDKTRVFINPRGN